MKSEGQLSVLGIPARRYSECVNRDYTTIKNCAERWSPGRLAGHELSNQLPLGTNELGHARKTKADLSYPNVDQRFKGGRRARLVEAETGRRG
jgi:hypothetical protein